MAEGGLERLWTQAVYEDRRDFKARLLLLLCYLLFPLGWLMAKGHRWIYERGLLPREKPVLPVISVGNLSVGGTGKSAFVAWLWELLVEEGYRPALLLRGYRGKSGASQVVESDSLAELVGDEALMLKRQLPEAVIVVGKQRQQSLRLAQQAGCELALLDDGFQYLKLQRDADILLLHVRQTLKAGRLLPLGALREPLDLLEHAACCVITGEASQAELAAVMDLVGRKAPSVPVARAEYELVRLATPGQWEEAGPEALQDLSVLAFCGLGNPAGFEASLGQAGAKVVELASFPDHHSYTQDEIMELEARRQALGATVIVCTEKDAVKLAGLELPATLRIVQAQLTLELGASLLATRLTLLLDDVIR